MAIPSWLKQVAAILYDDAGNRIKAGGANGLAVEGPAAAGAAIASAGNPILIAGKQNVNGVVDLALTNSTYSGILVAPGIAVTAADNDPNAGVGGVALIQTQAALGKLAIASYLFNGATWDRQRTPTTFKTLAAVAITAGTPVAGWTPASGKKFRLMGYALSLSVAGSVILKDATTEIARTPLMPAGDGKESPNLGNGILSALANNVLNIDVTATGAVSGFIFGTEE